MTKRLFKTNRNSGLARMLLDFTDIEVRYQKAYGRGKKHGRYVKERTIMAYFGSPEMQKQYPKEEIEAMLSKLVDAGLLEFTETET